MRIDRRFTIPFAVLLALIISFVFTTSLLNASDTQRPMQSHDFTDVPVGGKEWMEPFINDFYHQGVTGGCNAAPLEYCPEATVTRAEMAVFFGRALGYRQAALEGFTTEAFFKQTGSGYGMVAHSASGTGTRSSGVYGIEAYGTFGSGVYANSTNFYGITALSSTQTGMFVRGSTNKTDLYSTDTIYDILLGGSIGEIFSDGPLALQSNGSIWVDIDRNQNDNPAYFRIHNGTLNSVFVVDESGNVTLTGNHHADGNTSAGGVKSAIVDTVHYGTRKLYAVESTEVWFEDMGRAKLRNGSVVISIDRVFAETVNLNENYEVFLTPIGASVVLYISDMTATSFTVRADDAPDIEFSYRIVAKRLGYEDMRLEEAGD